MNRPSRRPRRSADQPRRLVVRCADDQLSMLAFSLGFVPHESFVVAVYDCARLVVTVRMNIADALQGGPRMFAEWLPDLIAPLHVPTLVLAAFTVDECAGRTCLADAMGVSPCEVIEALRADGERWWSLMCDDPQCCPPEGRPYDLTTSVIASEAVVEGMPLLGSREELCRQWLAPLDVRLDADVLADVGRVRAADAWPLIRAWRAGQNLTPAQIATLAVAADRPRSGPALARRVVRKNADDLVELWSLVFRSVPDDYAGGALSQLALASWVSGCGAVLNDCVGLLADLGVATPLADLLTAVAATGAPPTFWEDLGRRVA